MDDNETYMNKKPTKTDIQAPSRDYLNSTYTELNIRKVERFPNTQTDGLNSIYSVVKRPEDELHIDDYDVPPIASGPAEMSQTGAQKQEPKQNIGNRSVRKISLLCLVTIGVAMVAGLSIYVSQTRQSLITADRNYRRLWEQHQEMNRTQRQYQQHVHELNTTLESRTSENSLLDLSQRTCLNSLSAMNNNLTILENNISVLNSDLSELNRTHNDLRYQFNQLEMKYRNITENKAQICQYLIRRTVAEQTCPQIWIKNEDRCYFISKIANTYDGARQHCSEFDSGLLEINSNKEKNFVSNAVYQSVSYWIGKCANRNVASDLLYKISYGSTSCSNCGSYGSYNCKWKHRFICEKSAHLDTDIPEEIKGFCQQPVGPSSIN
ncbi:oxidized low-density lipoprotein receptor 1-like isoform X4 [Hypanus sabinus]|uniref:oxidized low-density lipoprotein receptor 1-like isoform X4 n=1 Tax=Hypanus sabinus TaxID=79690 RepID=UPI0028C473FD|nr:oxidized low-density lipoprotein receptor 1-like isoform X4 [Hypanus sabinus]